MTRVPVPAKINLALLVGSRRPDGLHEVATVLQRIDICDRIELEQRPKLVVVGFADTLVRTALTALAEAAAVEPGWLVRLHKAIPVASGLGGGSADAAAALTLANATLPRPLSRAGLAELARDVGADVPFFLEAGPKLAEGAGERLSPLELPQDYWIVLLLPRGVAKRATRDVYDRFDALGGGGRFGAKRTALLAALAGSRRPLDLGALPPNDLAEAAAEATGAARLMRAGAFRADLSGAGPAVYGLFQHRRGAETAAAGCRRLGRVWVTAPVW